MFNFLRSYKATDHYSDDELSKNSHRHSGKCGKYDYLQTSISQLQIREYMKILSTTLFLTLLYSHYCYKNFCFWNALYMDIKGFTIQIHLLFVYIPILKVTISFVQGKENFT